MSAILQLDNDTAIVPGLIVRVELVDAYVNMYTTTTRHQEWNVVVTTTGGATFILHSEPYSWRVDDHSYREKASEHAKSKAAVVFERVLLAVESIPVQEIP